MNFKKIKTLVVCAVCLAFSASLYAQTNVSGTVTDENGEPVVGATVIIPGTTRGTSTSGGGTYSINPGNSESLEFSCLGYETQIVPLNGRVVVDVVLKEDATLLDETVVIGYGVQKKVNLTGAVSVITADDLENRASMQVSNMLQGTMAGVNVTNTSGIPGSSSTVNVRGYTSINGGDPLVLIDGAVGELDRINATDIESISVIKDASAAAVYGGRAAFGVILVTTKTAKDGQKPKVQLSARWGWKGSTVDTNYETTGYWSVYTINAFYSGRYGSGQKYMDYNDYDMMQLLARVNDKTENPNRPWVVEEVRNGRNQWVYYCNTDWWHENFNDNRPTQSYNISVTGGSKAVKYFISGGYEREVGMLAKNPDVYNKFNVRAKVDAEVTKWMTFSNNASLFNSKYYAVGNYEIADTIGYISRTAFACFPLQNPDGSWIYMTPYAEKAVGNGRHIMISENTHRNWIRISDLSNTSSLEIRFCPTLKVNADFTYREYEKYETHRSQPWYYREYPDGELLSYDTGAGLNYLRELVSRYQWYTANAYITYDETYKGGHHLSITAGANYEYRQYKRVGAQADYLISLDLDDLSLQGTNDDGETIDTLYGNQNNYALIGYFARINYDYKERYLIELSGRYDGSSRFAKGNRYGFFPSGSVGWRISEEPFFQSARDIVDNLKIRFSYGRLGNQNIDDYYSYARLISNGNLSWSFGDTSTLPRYSSLADPVATDMTWEIAEHYDVGVDLTMLQNRLDFTADAYIRNTIGMLTDGMDLPSVYGADVPEMNAGNLQTKGYEVSASWRDHFMLGGRLFEYSIGGMFSDYASYITKFQNDTKILENYYEGQRIGELWGYRADGIFQTQQEVDEYLAQVDYQFFTYHGGLQVGDIRIKDLDGDGVLSNGSNTYGDTGDKVVIGNDRPSFQYGFNGSVKYFGFDVSVFFQGTGNHYYYPNSADTIFWGPFASFGEPSFIQKNFIDKCWSVDNPDALFPRPSANARGSGSINKYNDRLLVNLRYLRLKNLTVGYTLPEKITRKAYMEKVRIYFTGENLKWWSPLHKWSDHYLDPEQIVHSNSDSSRDNATYTFGSTYMFGIDITF